MKIDKAFVELKGGCLYVYADSGWPPQLPPIVKACHKRVRELFDFFREHGIGYVQVGAVEIPMSCIHVAVALAIMLYVAEFDKEVAYELCRDAPDAIKALVADAVRWSMPRSGPAIEPKYYPKLAAAFKEIVDVWKESKNVTLDDYI
jgi:hypothetical protein